MKNNLPIRIFLIFLFAAFLAASCKSSETVINSKENNFSEESSNILPEERTVQKGNEAYYSGGPEKALSIFREILKQEPGNREAELNFLYILYETGKYSEALDYLNSASDSRESGFINADDISFLYHNGNENIPLSMIEGAAWEDPLLPVFLSGNSEKYLEKAGLKEPGIKKNPDKENSSAKKDNSESENETLKSILPEDVISELQDKIEQERLFFAALAYKNTGETDKAIEVLEKTLNKRSYYPAARLLLGQLYFEKGDFLLSAKHINTALKDDSNQTAGRVTLAKTILAGGRLSEGHAALKRAAAVRPWDRETAFFLKTFEENNPDLVTTKKEAEQKRMLSMKVPEASVFTPETEVMPHIRIGLAENLQELYIKPGGDFRITDNAGNILAEGEKNTVLKVTPLYGTVVLTTGNGENFLKHQGTPVINCVSPENTILMFNVVHSTGYLSAGKEDRSYRGSISLKPAGSGITVINTVPLEEYLYSVVPSEIPSYWPEEALCAQAVAARSYTLANMGRYRKKGYDVTGSIKSHFYRGFTGENEKTTAAVEKTRGVVLKAEGKYLNAFYSANSAGRTESAESVWGGKYPLTGVTDPQLSFKYTPPALYELARWILSEPESYSSNPKYYYRSSYRWQLLVPAEEIEERTGYSVGDIKSITTAGRGKSGRVEKVLIKGTKGEKTIRGDKIRKSLGGLRSSLFIVLPKLDNEGMPEYFLFAGAGWGHGVGMCQTGAAGMAHEGFSFREILKHYYPAAELESIY